MNHNTRPTGNVGRGRGRAMIVNEIVDDLRRPNSVHPIDGNVSMVNPANQLVNQAHLLNSRPARPEDNAILQRLYQLEQQAYAQSTAEEVKALIERLNKVEVNNCQSEPQRNPEMNKFTLSAEAPEFVPRSFVAQPAPVQAQAAPYLTQILPPEFQQNNQMFPDPLMELYNHPTIVEVNNLVVELSVSPDRYYSISRKISSLLNANTEADVMKEVVTVIFEQGQGEPNFRYHGAKLCADLCHNVNKIFKQKTFKVMLLERLNDEFNIREILLYNEPERFRGYLMFFAEIFTQVTSTDNCPFNVFADSICDLLLLLTSNSYHQDEDISCVTKVLKFTGSALDQVASKKMELVISDVRQILLQPNIKESTKKQLMSIIELRAGNWGKNVSSSSEESTSSDKPKQENVPVFETVYYGPNGVIKTVDEKFDESTSDVEEALYSAELDGEAAAAFEEFLKLQEQQ